MQITEILAQMGGLQSIAKKLGVSETQATSAAEAGGSQGSPASSVGLASMMDLNGDGNPLDDIMGTVGKVIR